MAHDKKGYTRHVNQRYKEVVGEHVAKLVNVTFSTELNFTAASVQYFAEKLQYSHIQFTLADVNDIEEVGNVINAIIVASGSHTLTFSDDFILARNDFVGLAGTFYLYFTYQQDGKVLTMIVQA